MADESESIGGINVNIGASHAQLPGDLAAADRIFEEYRARWTAPVQIRAQAVQPQQAVPVRPVAAQPAAAVSFGPGVQTRVQGQQAQTALQRAINAELSKTGEIFNSQTGEIESATKKYREQQQAVAAVREEAAQPAAIAIDTKPLQDDLQAVLATMREIAAEAKAIASTPVSSPSGGTSGGARRSGALTEAQRRAANNLNALGSPSVQLSPIQSSQVTFVPGRDDQPVRPIQQGGPSEAQRRIAEDEARRAAVAASRPSNDPVSVKERARAEQVVAQAQERQGLTARRNAIREEVAFRQAADRRSIQEAAIARQKDIAVARNEANILTGSRTPRTGASAAGGLLLGPGRQRIELEERLTAATKDYNSAQTFRQAFDSKIAAKEAEATVVGGTRATQLRKEADIIRARPDRAKAIEEETAALRKQETAQADLTKFEKSPLNLARNLLAVTAAGFAFGAGLKAIDFAASAITPALGDAIDAATGFGATSNKVTVALAQQTLAAHGNVGAVLADAEAQAGLSQNAADAIDSQIKLTTQIKAGAQAAGAAGGLFRAALGANQQTPQGLLGGFGGLGGGPILAQQLGGGAGLAETIKSTFGDFSNATQSVVNSNLPTRTLAGKGFAVQVPTGEPPTPLTDQEKTRIVQIAKDRAAAEESLNKAAERGAAALGATTSSIVHFGNITAAEAQSLQASNLPEELKDLAKNSNEALRDSSGNLITTFKQATDGLQQVGAGLSIPDTATFGRIALNQELQRQRESAASIPALQSAQQFALPAQIAAIVRQQQDQLLRTLPATQALGNLANPLRPTTTGLSGKVGNQQIAANSQEQGRITAGLKEANALQTELNAGYEQGREVIRQTYDPAIFRAGGQAAVTAFHNALDVVAQTGQRIAQIQAGISNESAAYQTAQYNFQLVIAKRNLSDIGGLVGKNFGAGQSYLGVLEGQNLALSRQGQLLQFALSQRQINFQTALAGFQAPGVTPEERQARIKEAKIEAEFAQKQLNLNKQQFSNQVKIVDISNLRQGADLARQIALLIQGRQVTIDTAVAQKKLDLLAIKQQQNVAKVSTYFNTVDSLTAQAMSDIHDLELAAGKAMTGLATTVLGQFGIVIKGLTQAVSGGSTGNTNTGGLKSGRAPNASGGVYKTQGPTAIGSNALAGEAGGETLLILSHPRAMSMTGEGGGGGVTNIFNITGNTVRNDSDLDVLVSEVTRRLGREASLKGLRGIS